MRRLLLVLVIIMPLMLVGCVSMALPKVSNRAPEAAVGPAINAGSREEWEAGRTALLTEFQEAVYGQYPSTDTAEVLSQRVVDDAAYDGAGTVEEFHVSMSGVDTYIVTVRPNRVSEPAPVVILQMFCGNRAALGGREDISLGPNDPNCNADSWMMMPVTMIFGRHIMEPPVADILARGYALAFVYPGDIVPDSARSGAEALERLVPEAPSGAIAAWAWVYSRAIDVLETQPAFDPERMAVWGHSRNGKSALLAAVFDERVDLVISHQSGTGGTTLSRSDEGESVAQITESYPHWFAPAYAGYGAREQELPVDQHQLIALMAPRPLLIGGSWRDNWSDPQGSFLAAQAASDVYRLYGSQGLRQPDLASFDPDADIALFMRRGLHGVTRADWDNFLVFLDAHFQPE